MCRLACLSSRVLLASNRYVIWKWQIWQLFYPGYGATALIEPLLCFLQERQKALEELCLFCCSPPPDLMWAAVQNLCSTMKGIGWDSATVCCEMARVDTWVANPGDRPRLILHSPRVTRDVLHCAGALQTIENFLRCALHIKMLR